METTESHGSDGGLNSHNIEVILKVDSRTVRITGTI